MSEIYKSAFKLPEIRIRDVHVVYPMAAKLPHQVQGPYAAVDRNRRNAVSSESPNVYSSIRILRTKVEFVWKDNIVPFLYPALSFGKTRVIVSFYVILSREAEILMIAELTGYAAENVDTRKVRNWACCKRAHFLTICLWCGFTVLPGWTHIMSVFSGFMNGGALRSCMPFSMTLSNPLISYSYDSKWMLTCATNDISEW